MHPLVLLLALAVEVPITSPTLGPAALMQYGAAAASDGDGYLAVWTDGRANRAETRATRVTRDGDVLDPTGIVLPMTERPDIVWTGNSYLLVWGQNAQTWGMRLDRNGQTIDAPRVLIAAGTPSSVAVKDMQVVIGYFTPPDVRAAFFDANAQPQADVRLGANVQDRYALRIIPTRSGFTATWLTIIVPYVWNGARATLEGVRFDRNGAIGEPRILIDEPYVQDVTIASDGDAYVVVARDASNLLNARSVSADLATIGTRNTLPEPILRSLSLLWTGSQYVLIGEGGVALHAQKLDRNATPGDSVPFDYPPFSGTAVTPMVATNGSDLLVTWASSYGFDLATGLDVYGSLVSASNLGLRRRELLTRSAPRQTRPQLTNGGTNVLATWTENGVVLAKRLDAKGNAIDANPLRVSDGYQVTVSFNYTSYIVSWFDFMVRQIVTRRIPRDGALRIEDVARIDVTGASSLASASNGNVTLLAWHEYDKVRAMRPGIDATATTITDAIVGKVSVAANGANEFLVVWGTQIPGRHHAGPTPESVRGARITNAMTILDGNGFDIAASSALEGEPVVASNGREWLVLWIRGASELRARRVAANGMLLDAESFVTDNVRAPQVVWDGARYALAWLESNAFRMHTAWLTQAGASLIGDRVLATVDSDFIANIAIAPLRAGMFMAAYARIDDRPQIGGVARAYVTVQGDSQMKRRAVR
jgi:hypothetical protein